MSWQKILISQFGGPEVLELIEESTIPDPGPGEIRIKVLAAGTGFTDIFIRRGRYPDYNGPLPFVPPDGRRMVIGQGTWVRQYCVPALFRTWLSAMLEKSANCISATGR